MTDRVDTKNTRELDDETIECLAGLAESDMYNVQSLIDLIGPDIALFEVFLEETGRVHDPTAQGLAAKIRQASGQLETPSGRERGGITKADLVEEIARQTGLSEKDVGIVVNEILENILRALAGGDKVELRGFGSFNVKERRSRRARNPRTGQGVYVPAKLVPYFKASKELKTRVNED